MKKLSVACLTTLLLASLPLHALNVRQGVLPNKRLFAIEFPDNTSFYARHDKLNSISMQRYQSGPYIVREVVIDISESDVLLRIYHTQLMNVSTAKERSTDIPNPVGAPTVPDEVQKLIDRGRKGADKAVTGGLVVKDYPTSTHAKTIEYRVDRESELIQFYERFVDIYTGRDSPANEEDPTATRINLSGTVFRIDGD